MTRRGLQLCSGFLCDCKVREVAENTRTGLDTEDETSRAHGAASFTSFNVIDSTKSRHRVQRRERTSFGQITSVSEGRLRDPESLRSPTAAMLRGQGAGRRTIDGNRSLPLGEGSAGVSLESELFAVRRHQGPLHIPRSTKSEDASSSFSAPWHMQV